MLDRRGGLAQRGGRGGENSVDVAAVRGVVLVAAVAGQPGAQGCADADRAAEPHGRDADRVVPEAGSPEVLAGLADRLGRRGGEPHLGGAAAAHPEAAPGVLAAGDAGGGEIDGEQPPAVGASAVTSAWVQRSEPEHQAFVPVRYQPRACRSARSPVPGAPAAHTPHSEPGGTGASAEIGERRGRVEVGLGEAGGVEILLAGPGEGPPVGERVLGGGGIEDEVGDDRGERLGDARGQHRGHGSIPGRRGRPGRGRSGCAGSGVLSSDAAPGRGWVSTIEPDDRSGVVVKPGIVPPALLRRPGRRPGR